MKNSRNTTAKTAIITLIEESDMALSHSDIQKELGEVCNRVTIYRILDRLLEEDLVHKVVDTDGIAKFLACNHCADNHDHHHLHFSCSRCGEITCLHRVIPQFELPKQYVLEEVNCTVKGICPKCN